MFSLPIVRRIVRLLFGTFLCTATLWTLWLALPRSPLVRAAALKPSHTPSVPAPPTLEPEGEGFFVLEQGDPQSKMIAFTFDDGPHPEATPRLLQRLRELNVKVTFFVVGEKVEESPDLLRMIATEGHEIANHTYAHINLIHYPEEVIEDEIAKTNVLVKEICGKRPRFFRPPGGRFDARVLTALRGEGVPMALWSSNPQDFLNPTRQEIERRVLKDLHGGDIVLLHSAIEPTFEALPHLVAEVRKRGYRFVTLSEMSASLPQNLRRFKPTKILPE
jgi:peptidoglycan/xylan/chitin deacetylase (PgdA/CDA1 family)